MNAATPEQLETMGEALAEALHALTHQPPGTTGHTAAINHARSVYANLGIYLAEPPPIPVEPDYFHMDSDDEPERT